MSQITLNFRTTTVLDEAGNPVKDEAGKELKAKRASFSLELATLTAEQIIEILQAGESKEAQLIIDSCAEAVFSAAKAVVADNLAITGNDNFPHDKVTWTAIANQPPAQRRGGGIAKEQWQDFATDYVAVMQEAAGKTEAQATAQAKVLVSKFAGYRSDKQVLEAFKGLLAVYLGASPNAEEYSDCVEALITKADELLAVDASDALGLL